MLPICYGRLNMTTEQIENACLCEIEMMIQGWKQRYKDLQALFVLYSAIPIHNSFSKKKARFEDFVKEEKELDDFSDLSIEEMRQLAE